MPSRNAKQAKKASDPRGVLMTKTKRSRKLNFENESWYEATARRMSASRTAIHPPLNEMPSPPLASE
jgi:hypothetical protein